MTKNSDSNKPLAYSLLSNYPNLVLAREENDQVIFKGTQSDCQSYATKVKSYGGVARFKKGLKSNDWYVSVRV